MSARVLQARVLSNSQTKRDVVVLLCNVGKTARSKNLLNNIVVPLEVPPSPRPSPPPSPPSPPLTGAADALVPQLLVPYRDDADDVVRNDGVEYSLYSC